MASLSIVIWRRAGCTFVLGSIREIWLAPAVTLAIVSWPTRILKRITSEENHLQGRVEEGKGVVNDVWLDKDFK